jgi:uncharacterized membrane protein
MNYDSLYADAGAPADALVLDIRLEPSDSLGDRGFFVFTTTALSLVMAIDLALVVPLFFALDGLCLVAAGLLCRRARRRSERIIVSGGTVRISRFRGHRLIDQQRLPVFGLSIEREDDPDYGCQRVSLILRGKRYDVAADLAPRERENFVDHLIQALEAAGGKPRVHRIKRLPLLAAFPSYAQ